MTIPNCDKCGKKQTELGALLFGPPHQSGLHFGCVIKFHLCKKCYLKIAETL